MVPTCFFFWGGGGYRQHGKLEGYIAWVVTGGAGVNELMAIVFNIIESASMIK